MILQRSIGNIKKVIQFLDDEKTLLKTSLYEKANYFDKHSSMKLIKEMTELIKQNANGFNSMISEVQERENRHNTIQPKKI